jgi:flagellin
MSSSGLEDAQGAASSGLRIRNASDNSAYWSISTTMRSDNKALSAVTDALGLGSAVVDVAYTGLDTVISVLDEIKSKVVAAREPGVDRTKIQSELAELKAEVRAIAGAANFNGVNWLSTGLAQNLADVSTFGTELVASFVRSQSNSVAVKTIDLDLTQISLLNAGGGGILQKDVRSLGTIGGFRTSASPPVATRGIRIILSQDRRRSAPPTPCPSI